MSRKEPFKLVLLRNRRVSHDTVTCLRTLLRRAEAGEIIGIAYSAMEDSREYFFSACGEAHRNPAFASSMVGALWFDLQLQMRGEA